MALPGDPLSAHIRRLRPLQEKVVRLYFGLGCPRSHSAVEIALEFHDRFNKIPLILQK